MNTIRAFIAIHLPATLKNELGRVNKVLANQIPNHSVRWVRPELMHLTLRFLGDTAVSKLPPLYSSLDEIAAQHQPFTLNLDTLGCFPNRKRPRVIWAGLQGQLDAASRLKGDIDDALRILGWDEETRPFRPHMTLGRVKDSQKLRGVQWGADVEQLTLPVSAIHLVESALTPDGPIYTNRHTSFLTA